MTVGRRASIRRAGLYADAARRVRPVQVAGRIRRLIPPSALAVGLASRPAGAWQPAAAGAGVPSAPQSPPIEPPEREGVFRAYGRARRLEEPGFWTDKGNGLLFLFHLHGFAPLAAYAASERTESGDRFWADVLQSWLDEHGRPRLPAWHPYPTSARLIAWAAALSSVDGWQRPLRERVAGEIVRQCRYLGRTVEHDIGGNHVIKNATALVVAGSVAELDSVVDRGLRTLRREIARQLLPDGGHYERSPSYHREVLDDLADAVTVLSRSGRKVPGWLEGGLARGRDWLEAVAWPDGTLPLLNDAWEGPRVAGASPRRDHRLLRDSGYAVLRGLDSQAIVDLGAISPPELPAHAHADVLSFCLWWQARPLIIDPGAFSYTGPDRAWFRSTAAHNTVEVDGYDQCEFWGDFRAAYHPTVRRTELADQGDAVTVAGCHDGYRRLDEPVTHHRSFVWFPDGGIIVVDRLAAQHAHDVRTFLHLAPGESDPGRVGPFSIWVLGGGETTVAEGAYAPFLATKLAAPVLESRSRVEPDALFGWSVLRAGWLVEELTCARLELRRPDARLVTVPLSWVDR